MAEKILQSVSYTVVFRAILASDGKTPAAGKTIAITISKNTAAFGNPNIGALNATQIGSGYYYFTMDTTDTGTLGPLIWKGIEGTINDAGDILNVVDPATIGLLTTNSVVPSNPVDNSIGEALFLMDAMRGRKNTAQAGAASTITLDAAASAVAGTFVGDDIFLYGGTGGGLPGVGQIRTITSYNTGTKVATVNRNWTTNPDNTTKFMIIPRGWTNLGLTLGTLSAAAAGSVSVDWAHIVNPTTTVDLTGTTINTTDNPVLATLTSSQPNYAPALASVLDTYYANLVTDIANGAGAVVLSASQPSYAPALASVLATDYAAILAAITSGCGTVTLAASQPSYTPAKAGDKMDLINAPNATAIAAVTNGLMLASSYTAPNNAGIISIVNKLPAGNIADEAIVISALTAVNTEVLAIKTQTDQITFSGSAPTALVKVDVESLGGDSAGVAGMSASAKTIVTGAVAAGSTAATINTTGLSPSPTRAKQFNNRLIMFLKTTSTTFLQSQFGMIQDMTADGIITLASALTDAPAVGDQFVII